MGTIVICAFMSHNHTYRYALTHMHTPPFLFLFPSTYVVWQGDIFKNTLCFLFPHSLGIFLIILSYRKNILSLLPNQAKNFSKFWKLNSSVLEISLITPNSQCRIWITLHRLRKTRKITSLHFLYVNLFWFSGSSCLVILWGFMPCLGQGALFQVLAESYWPDISFFSVDLLLLQAAAKEMHTALPACMNFRSFFPFSPPQPQSRGISF